MHNLQSRPAMHKMSGPQIVFADNHSLCKAEGSLLADHSCGRYRPFVRLNAAFGAVTQLHTEGPSLQPPNVACTAGFTAPLCTSSVHVPLTSSCA